MEQRTSNNRDDLLSICSLIDQLRAMFEIQFSSLTDQLQVLSESANTAQPPAIPTSSGEIADIEHAVVIEGLHGKVKGLEQTIVIERNAVIGLRDMVVDLSERVDSSLSTAVTS